MADIIPEEALIIPLLILLMAFLTPFITVPLVFGTINRLLKKNKARTAMTNILGIAALLFPLWFLFMDKYQISIFASILICFISSIVVIIIHYLLSKEKRK
jgi:hypothetical protein